MARTKQMSARGEERSTLPSDRAFLVQFEREDDGDPPGFRGRLEHLSSGRRRSFAAVEEFLALMKEMLREQQAGG